MDFWIQLLLVACILILTISCNSNKKELIKVKDRIRRLESMSKHSTKDISQYYRIGKG
jgi:hypothetical protein